jgi:hypothetical protein
MSKLLDNKQIIHIVSEIVIILGITFYFTQKNKKLMNHINDLTQRIEEQEDILQKHEQMITKLSSMIEELNSRKSGFFSMDNFPKEMKVPNSKNSMPTPSPNTFSHSTIILENIPVPLRNNKSPISQSSRVVEIVDDKVDYKVDDKVDYKVDDKVQKNIINKKQQESKKNENIPIKKEIVEELSDEPSDEPSEEPSEEDLDAELEDELKDLD